MLLMNWWAKKLQQKGKNTPLQHLVAISSSLIIVPISHIYLFNSSLKSSRLLFFFSFSFVFFFVSYSIIYTWLFISSWARILSKLMLWLVADQSRLSQIPDHSRQHMSTNSNEHFSVYFSVLLKKELEPCSVVNQHIAHVSLPLVVDEYNVWDANWIPHQNYLGLTEHLGQGFSQYRLYSTLWSLEGMHSGSTGPLLLVDYQFGTLAMGHKISSFYVCSNWLTKQAALGTLKRAVCTL